MGAAPPQTYQAPPQQATVAAPAPPPQAAPGHQLMAVTCPPNTGPGAAVQIQGPSGGMFQVQVPAGVAPGQTFHVQVPLAPPTQTATAMPQQMQQPMMYQ